MRVREHQWCSEPGPLRSDGIPAVGAPVRGLRPRRAHGRIPCLLDPVAHTFIQTPPELSRILFRVPTDEGWNWKQEIFWEPTKSWVEVYRIKATLRE